MADPVDTRLRAARPPAADVDPNEIDADLLALVQRQPSRPPARHRRLAIPAVGLVAAGAAALLLISPSGPAAPPTAAAAVRQAQEWFAPSGGILHIRSVLTSFRPGGGSDELVQETWQSVDHPERQRYLQSSNGLTSESAGEGGVYDTERDTIYLEGAPARDARAVLRESIERKIAAAKESGIISKEDIARIRADGERALEDFGKRADDPEPTPPLGDQTAAEIRKLLDQGDAELGLETTHAGVAALPITLWPNGTGPEKPRWTLWTAADDGRPLELRIDNGPGTDPLQTTRWTVYELLDSAPLTLTGAHPGARIVRDPEAYEAATARLYPNG